MKAKYSAAAVALAGLLGLQGTALMAATYGNDASVGQQNSNAANPANPSQTPTPSIQSFMGSVQSVDKVNKTVQLKDSTGTVQTFTVGSSTQLTRDGEAVQLSQLNIGDKISVKTINSSM